MDVDRNLLRAFVEESTVTCVPTSHEQVCVLLVGPEGEDRVALATRDGRAVVPPIYSQVATSPSEIRTLRVARTYAPRRTHHFVDVEGILRGELASDETRTIEHVGAFGGGYADVRYAAPGDDHEHFLVDSTGRQLGLMGSDVTTCYEVCGPGGDLVGVHFGNSWELMAIQRETNQAHRVGPNFSNVAIPIGDAPRPAIVTLEGERSMRVATPRGDVSEEAYDRILPFSETGFAIAWRGKRRALIDREGKEVLPFGKLDVRATGADCVVFVGDKKSHGIATLEGEVLVDASYTDVVLPTSGRAERFLVGKGKNYRIIDRSGRELLSAKALPAKGTGGVATETGNWFVQLADGSYCFIDGATLDVVPITFGRDDLLAQL